MTAFNPFTQSISSTERLRIRHHQLIIEDKSVSSNKFFRFLKFKQYGQESILNKMKSIYQKSLKENTPISESFINNYDFLIKKAENHNLRHKKSCLFFLFKIDSKKHKILLEELKNTSLKAPTTEVDLHWWGEASLEEEILIIPEFGALGCPYLKNLLELINPELAFDEKQESPQNLQIVFNTLKLSYVRNYVDLGLINHKKFKEYLEKNRADFTQLIVEKHANLLKKKE